MFSLSLLHFQFSAFLSVLCPLILCSLGLLSFVQQAVLNNISSTFDGAGDEPRTSAAAAAGSKTVNQMAKEIDALLKHGAYDLFNQDAEQSSKQFGEADIDSILQRAKVVGLVCAL
jgi:hypothetical protein